MKVKMVQSTTSLGIILASTGPMPMPPVPITEVNSTRADLIPLRLLRTDEYDVFPPFSITITDRAAWATPYQLLLARMFSLWSVVKLVTSDG